MSNIVPIQNQAITNWSPDQIQLLKSTVCKGATDDEFKIFCYAVQRTGLDPFMKQIHAVKRFDKKLNREVMSIQVGIDGYRLAAERTGKYAGSDDPIFDDEASPAKATVTVYKMVEGQRCAFTASARWAEYVPGPPQDFMWKKMPCVMLGKVAEALALRKAFPAELSGLYTNEEMQQADTQPHNPHAAKNNQPEPGDGVQPDLPACDCGAVLKFTAKKSGRYPDGCWYCPNFKDATVKHSEPVQPAEYEQWKKEMVLYALEQASKEDGKE